ncbi:hypothetical protein ILUMI_02825 [Ignelater luminosus]|uniref:Uncharacterized protein n=1 Tax=Ignelater luminosus TaxID=2038154 RepID=A0A8K0GMT9_IGNLU|nr:hypothetical protein ILUMI_02825 [Ignelater luminosus]
MAMQSFHFVQQQMETYFDTITVEKKNFMPWSRRLHLALLAYRELLLTLTAMDKSPDGTVRDSSKVMKSNIFYVVEYRELLVSLLITFDELKMSMSYLNDLLETQHIFVRMFQAFCEKHGDVVVQKKSKARRKTKKKKASAVETAVADVPTEMNLDALWDEAAPQLSAVLQNPSHITTDVVPFDAASDLSDEEQKLALSKL